MTLLLPSKDVEHRSTSNATAPLLLFPDFEGLSWSFQAVEGRLAGIAAGNAARGHIRPAGLQPAVPEAGRHAAAAHPRPAHQPPEGRDSCGDAGQRSQTGPLRGMGRCRLLRRIIVRSVSASAVAAGDERLQSFKPNMCDIHAPLPHALLGAHLLGIKYL